MTILSTRRSLAFQFWDNLRWLLSGWLSPPTGSLITLSFLNDDCLLLILDSFSVGQLFQLRAVSRRLCHLIEQYRLPQVKTLIYGYEKAGGSKETPCLVHSGTVEVYFTRRTHVYSQFCRRTGFFADQHERILPVSELVPIRLCTLPLSLPFFLSHFEVICSLDDYATFLGVKPTYEDTLKTLEVHLYNTYDWELFKVTTQCFSSLERLFIRAFLLPNENLVPIFTDLGRLPHLREFLYLAMSISQLSHLYHRHLTPGALPTLTSIRQVTITIYLPEGETFDSIEFLYHIVPLLLGIFDSLENLCLHFIELPSSQEHSNQVLSGILTNWVKKLFPGIHHCTAYYYLRKQNFLET